MQIQIGLKKLNILSAQFLAPAMILIRLSGGPKASPAHFKFWTKVKDEVRISIFADSTQDLLPLSCQYA